MSTSRREALKGATALVAAAAAVTVSTIATATEDSVIALVAEWERLHAESLAVSNRAEAIRNSLPEWCRLSIKPSRQDIESPHFIPLHIGGIKASLLVSGSPGAALAEARREVDEYRANALREWEEKAAARDRMRQESGLYAAEERFEALLDQRDAMEERVWSTPATTIAGIAAKMAVAAYATDTRDDEFSDFEEDLDPSKKLLVSVRRDAERMAGRASS